jgi:hypothetical protein
MAFGDSGRHKFLYKGVPFRVDGATREEAQARMQAAIDSGEADPVVRGQRLGLTPRDLHSLETRGERAQQQRLAGQTVDPDAALRGQTNVPESLEGVGLDLGNLPPVWAAEKLTGMEMPNIPLQDDVARTLIGTGRFANSRVRGVQQIVGGKATEQELAAQAATEEDIYQQFGKGLGLEDVGEAAIPLLTFYLTGGLSGGSLLTAGATGAALNATEEQTDPSSGGRAMKGAVGALEGVVGQGVGNMLLKRAAGLPAASGNVFARIASAVKGQSYGAGGPRMYFQFLNLSRNPNARRAAVNATTQSTADAAEVAATTAAREAFRTEQGQLYSRLSREVLDKIEMGVRSLPMSERAGASAAVRNGLFQGILKSSIEVKDGVATLNPGLWQQGMAAVAGRMQSLFKQPGHAQLVTDMNAVVRAMGDQKAAGVRYTAESVQQATAALRRAVMGNVDDAAPAAVRLAAAGSATQGEAEAVSAALAALRAAPAGSEAQRSLIQAIIDRGRQAGGIFGERSSEEVGDYAAAEADELIQHFFPEDNEPVQ